MFQLSGTEKKEVIIVTLSFFSRIAQSRLPFARCTQSVDVNEVFLKSESCGAL